MTGSKKKKKKCSQYSHTVVATTHRCSLAHICCSFNLNWYPLHPIQLRCFTALLHNLTQWCETLAGEGGISPKFMVAWGFRLSRHKWLSFAAGLKKMENYVFFLAQESEHLQCTAQKPCERCATHMAVFYMFVDHVFFHCLLQIQSGILKQKAPWFPQK